MRLYGTNSLETGGKKEQLHSFIGQSEEKSGAIKTRPPSSRPTDDEIRQKIKERNMKSLRRQESAKKIKQMHQEVVDDPHSENPDYQLKSDIAVNDPNDSNTQEKLKSILKTGSFHFSEREKAALSKILKD